MQLDMTVPMFDPPTPAAPPPRPRRRAGGDGGSPQWSRYRPKQRVPCDDCLLLLHENGGNGPYPQPAVWKRRRATSTLLLCYDHARAWRADDGGNEPT